MQQELALQIYKRIRFTRLPLCSVSPEHSPLYAYAIYLGLLLPAWPGSYIGPPLEAKLHHFSLGLMHLYITLPAFGPPKGICGEGNP